ncbi:hypothetical protein GQ43DRAFT_127749 [Delitschia confertaspora ATCC 74209]|uniref:Uncharacterized protein n=1 Tax=Delitschia confertaspora ATCC 74209 TaxID=1513339 RepID=A0A9P4JGS7_9PLEO|nr:hypothetical protein GQ43DRAFT_127749 [Delitschia confertaspora ATCC 74209]
MLSACLGFPSDLIVHTSTLFYSPKRSMAGLLTLPVCKSIASDDSILSALTAYHYGPVSFAPWIGESSHFTAVCLNIPSLSFSTENFMMAVLLFVCHIRKSFIIALASVSISLRPCVIVCFAASMVDIFSASPSCPRLRSITS